METSTKKLDARAWERRLVGYSFDSKSFRVYNPETRRVRESRKVVFIETPSALDEPDLVSGFDQRTFSYDDSDDLLRDLRNYTSRVHLGNSSSENRTSNDLSVRSLLDRIHEITARDLNVAPAHTESPETQSPGTPSSTGGGTSLSLAPGEAAFHSCSRWKYPGS